MNMLNPLEVSNARTFTFTPLEHLNVCVRHVSKSLTNNSWLKIHKYCPGHMFSRASFIEKSVEGIPTSLNGLVGRYLAIRL